MNAEPPGGARRGGAALYTPDLLALAVSLADHPFRSAHPRRAEARSRTCGSVVAASLDTDAIGRITAVGVRVSACAVGQAAAAIFAGGTLGHTAGSLQIALDHLSNWLDGGAAEPDWPQLAALRTVRPFPGRHAAILLPWRAGLRALSNPPPPD